MFGECIECEKYHQDNEKLKEENQIYKSNLFKMKSEITDISGLIKSYMSLQEECEKYKTENISLRAGGVAVDSEEVKFLKYEVNVTKKKLEQVNDSLNNIQLLNSQLIAENDKLQIRLNKDSEFNEVNKFKRELTEKEKAINKQNVIISQLKNEMGNKKKDIVEPKELTLIKTESNIMSNNTNDLLRAMSEIEYLQLKNRNYKNKYKKFKAQYTTTYSILEKMIQKVPTTYVSNRNNCNYDENKDRVNSSIYCENKLVLNEENNKDDNFLNKKRVEDIKDSKQTEEDKVINDSQNSFSSEEDGKDHNYENDDNIQLIDDNNNAHLDFNNDSIFNNDKQSSSKNNFLQFKNNNDIIKEKLNKINDDPFKNEENKSYLSKLRSAKRRLDDDEKQQRIESYRSKSKSKENPIENHRERGFSTSDTNLVTPSIKVFVEPQKEDKMKITLNKTYQPPSKISKSITSFNNTINTYSNQSLCSYINSIKESDELILSNLFPLHDTSYDRVQRIIDLSHECQNDFNINNIIIFYSKFINYANVKVILDYFLSNLIRLLEHPEDERQYINKNNYLYKNIIKLNINLHGKIREIKLDTHKINLITHKSIVIFSFFILFTILYSNESINIYSLAYSIIRHKGFISKILELLKIMFEIIKQSNLYDLIENTSKNQQIGLKLFSLKKVNQITTKETFQYLTEMIENYTNLPELSDKTQENLNYITNQYIITRVTKISNSQEFNTDDICIDLSSSSIYIEIYQCILISFNFLSFNQLESCFIGNLIKTFIDTKDKTIIRAMVIYYLSEVLLNLSEINTIFNKKLNNIQQSLGSWLFNIFNPSDISIQKRFSVIDRVIALASCMEIYSQEYIDAKEVKLLMSKVNLECIDGDLVKKIKSKFSIK